MELERKSAANMGLEPHRAARPMKVVVAEDGGTWLCDAETDETRGLKEQGCWRCGEMPFTRND